MNGTPSCGQKSSRYAGNTPDLPHKNLGYAGWKSSHRVISDRSNGSGLKPPTKQHHLQRLPLVEDPLAILLKPDRLHGDEPCGVVRGEAIDLIHARLQHVVGLLIAGATAKDAKGNFKDVLEA
ncbi:MAG: hypothetical protein M1813_007708 [Trichoglossum hirsutum]|nr:MAG: hypothetical protein M1813_007708 [Trichoglossum hirsutum]